MSVIFHAWSGNRLSLITPLLSRAPLLLAWRNQKSFDPAKVQRSASFFSYPRVSRSATIYLMCRPFEIFSENPSILLPMYSVVGSLLWTTKLCKLLISSHGSFPLWAKGEKNLIWLSKPIKTPVKKIRIRNMRYRTVSKYCILHQCCTKNNRYYT